MTMEFMLYVYITVFVAVYLVSGGVLFTRLAKRRRLLSFGRSINSILSDGESNENLDQDRIIDQINISFRRSPLNDRYNTSIEPMEIVFSLLQSDSWFSKQWKERECGLLYDILTNMREKTPFHAIDGEPRTLLQSVDASLGQENIAGKNALHLLAQRISKMEERIERQRKNNMASWIISVAGFAVGVTGVVMGMINSIGS